jgi:hypothetical protein
LRQLIGYSNLHQFRLQDSKTGTVLVGEGKQLMLQPGINKLNKLKLMKIKLLLMAAIIGAASMSAHAGVRIGLSIGLPIPRVVVVAPAPAVVVAAPVVYAPPVVVAPAVCPGPGYIWAPGYWSVNSYGRVWIGGGWRYHAAPARYAFGYGHAYDHGYGWHR